MRIALNLKGIEYEIVPLNLLKGEEKLPAYLSLNPQGLVPALELDSGDILTQSQAIIDYLEAAYPEPALVSADLLEAAQQRSMAAIIACDIHPLNNLRVLNYLANELDVTDTDKSEWYAHWIAEGFKAIEPQLVAAPYAWGAQPGLVDAFLIPQVYNALRFDVPLQDFPGILSVYEACNQLEAFKQASPEPPLAG